MKALSIKQPWAWLIVNGIKPIENRDWHCNYRGPLLIHAGKNVDRDGMAWLTLNWTNLGLHTLIKAYSKPMPDIMTAELGGIVGMVQMTDCVRTHPSPFFFGPYGFVMENPQLLPFKPWRGQLKIFEGPNLTTYEPAQ